MASSGTLSQSGSRWTSEHLERLRIVMDLSSQNPVLDPAFDPEGSWVDPEVLKYLGEIIDRRDISRRSQLDILKKVKFHMIGSFFVNLAIVSQKWQTSSETPSTPENRRSQRESKKPERGDYVSSEDISEDIEIDQTTPQKARGTQTPPSGRSYTSGPTTDWSKHAATVKSEQATVAMAMNFLQTVTESSRDTYKKRLEAKSRKSKCVLEWHSTPEKFTIKVHNVNALALNDGCLYNKAIIEGDWRTKSRLVYCSLETKRLLGAWLSNKNNMSQKGRQDVQVQAQETSELLGMMCQRLAIAKAMAAKKNIKMNDTELVGRLTSYDRTVCLVSCAANYIALKVAYFERKYIQDVLLRRVEDKQPSTPTRVPAGPPGGMMGDGRSPGRENEEEDSFVINRTANPGVPPCKIYSTRLFNLMEPDGRVIAASYVISMQAFLESQGPLLTNF